MWQRILQDSADREMLGALFVPGADGQRQAGISVMFADDTVISEIMEPEKEKWRYALESSGTNVRKARQSACE